MNVSRSNDRDQLNNLKRNELIKILNHNNVFDSSSKRTEELHSVKETVSEWISDDEVVHSIGVAVELCTICIPQKTQ